MDILPLMLGISLFLGLLGLFAFLWGLRTGQFDDPEGMRYKFLLDDEEEERYRERLAEIERDELAEKAEKAEKNAG